MRGWSRIGCATIIVGCSAAHPRVTSVESTTDAAVAADPTLCDGSDEFRLLVNDMKYEPSLQHLRSFEYPHNAYLAIDGHCHYIATWDFMLGIHAGDLSDSDLSSLESDLSLRRLASLRSTRSQCTDSSTVLISTLDTNLSARCPGSDGSTEAERALVNAEDWEMRLAEAGVPLDGPIHAQALRGEPPNLGDRTAPVVPWPLSRKVSEIPALLEGGDDILHPIGAPFDGDDAQMLRALRASIVMLRNADGLGPDGVYVKEDGVTYHLSVRDDLPEDVDRRLSDFIEQCWAQAPPP
jgi:hypothetical protein